MAQKTRGPDPPNGLLLVLEATLIARGLGWTTRRVGRRAAEFGEDPQTFVAALRKHGECDRSLKPGREPVPAVECSDDAMPVAVRST